MRIKLTVIKGPHAGREFSFEEHDNFIVGRAKFAQFRLPDSDIYMSHVHFMVEVNPPLCRLLDMKSKNGVRVNNQRVGSAELKDGDLIKAGKTVIRVSLHEASILGSQGLFDSEVSSASGEIEHRALVATQATPPTMYRSPTSTPPPAVASSFFKAPSPRTPDDPAVCRVCGAPLPELSSLRLVFSPGNIPLCKACRGKIRDHPQTIPGYQIIRELGRGGMGVVYVAVRVLDGALVALKTIQPAQAATRLQTERFLREASILGQLDHPHIVSFLEMVETEGMLYFAMDYVSGPDVAELQKASGGVLPIARAVDLACQMLEGLEYAHSKGFVHRDIKPANMLVERRGGSDVVRLTDFGVARAYETSPLSGLTLQGHFGGTMAFAAPEQITSFRDAKPPVDQYAAGATLYTMLTGKFVFDLPRQFQDQLLLILQGDHIPIRKRRPDVPEALAAVIHRSIARDPRARFPDVGAMRAALEPFRK
jgi:serine/threonine-protein kinase